MTITHLSADLRLAPPTTGSPTSADLIAFATYCAEYIARGLTGISGWELFLASGMAGESDAVVRARIGDCVVEARASAHDPAVAIWDAMRDVEQPLRDTLVRLNAA